MATVIDLPTLDSLRDEQRALRAQLARLRQATAPRARSSSSRPRRRCCSLLTAAVLVLLDWWFRFSLPVRACADHAQRSRGSSRFLAVGAVRRWRSSRIDELSLAVIARSLPAGRRPAGRRRAPASRACWTSPGHRPRRRWSGWPSGKRARRSAGSDWRSLWNRKRTGLHTAALLVGLLVPVLFGWWAPHAARLSFARWLLGSSERWPQQTYLTVMGLDSRGRLLAPRDERFLMEVRTDLPHARIAWRQVGRARPGRTARSVAGSRNGRGLPKRCRSGNGPPTAAPAPGRWSRPIRCGSATSSRRRRHRRRSSSAAATTGWDRSRLERVDRPSLADDPAPRQGARVEQPGVPQRRRHRASTCSSCRTPRSR